jgi:hypothetical protein
MSKYWESEKPQVVDTGKNVLRYFLEAKKLQVSMPNWKDKDGVEKPGKTVTLDVTALLETTGGQDLLRNLLQPESVPEPGA